MSADILLLKIKKYTKLFFTQKNRFYEEVEQYNTQHGPPK